MDKLRKAKHFLALAKRSLILVWRASPGLGVLWLTISIIQGILPILSIVLIAQITDLLVQFLQTRVVETQLLVMLAAFVTILISRNSLNTIQTWVNFSHSTRVSDFIDNKLNEKVISLDLSFFESSDNYDMLHQVYVNSQAHPLKLIQNLSTWMRSLLTLVGLIAIMTTYSVWFFPLLLLVTVPTLYLSISYSQQYHDWKEQNVMIERQTHYYGMLLRDKDIASEIRLFNLGNYYRELYSALRKQLRDEQAQLMRKQIVPTILLSFLGLGVICLILVAVAGQIFSGGATLGYLVALYQILDQTQKVIITIFKQISDTYRNLLFTDNLFLFLAYEPRIFEGESPNHVTMDLNTGISFNNVTFNYPNGKPVIKDLNWFIPSGKMIALIGRNGAGKSTLLKLLGRFYEPDQGTIKWDNQDIQTLPIQELRQSISVLFQFPFSYQTTLRENISLGNWFNNPTQADIDHAATIAGVNEIKSRLTDEYDTIIGQLFGKQELSGGEWQRIALARTLIRKTNLIILDEPTSAMDPWTEVSWVRNLRTNNPHQTIIIITHRLSTILQCDEIAVIENGQIVEQGSHQDLLYQNGFYQDLWIQQQSSVSESE